MERETTPTHSADAGAGDEVILSSDGAPPLPAIVPPPIQKVVEHSPDAVLDTESADLQQAWKTFGSPSVSISKTERIKQLQSQIDELEADDDDDVKKMRCQIRLMRLNLVRKDHDLEDGHPIRTPSMESSLAERVSRLEQACELGSSTASLAQRVQALETMKDDSQAFFRHVKTIRSDLEAASKAHSKLGASKQSQQIATLYEAHQEAALHASHLPTLLQRLQTLASIHTAAADHTKRLVETERLAKELSDTVHHLSATVDTFTTKTLPEHVQQMKANVDGLTEKLEN